jgi:hypothetical protein
MRLSRRRVGAILRKELRDYRRNRYMLVTMAIIPVIFLVQPVAYVLSLPASASVPLSHKDQLLYMLGIPALVPALIAASSVVTERAQGTLEPVLTTPVRREEFLLAKALAPLLPSVAVSYLVYGLFVVIIELFADQRVAPALLQAPVVIAQVLFHAADCCLVDLGRPRDLHAVDRHPCRATAQHAREPPGGRCDDPDRVQRDPRDTRSRARHWAGAARGIPRRLAGCVHPVRPRAAGDRNEIVSEDQAGRSAQRPARQSRGYGS